MVPQPGSFKDPKEEATRHDRRRHSKAYGKLLDKAESSSEQVHCAVVFVELNLVIVELQSAMARNGRTGRRIDVARIGD